MFKKILTRCLVSAPISILISQIIALCISLGMGSGEYFPVHPDFAALFENEITPVIVQMLLIGLISAAFAAGSVVFEIEKWGFLKQGLVHFAITAAVLLPVCMICWRPADIKGVIITIISLFFTYACTWLSRYFVWRHEIKKLNAKIQSVNREV